jgi:hypothetical protein
MTSSETSSECNCPPKHQHSNYYGALKHILKIQGEATQANTYGLGIDWLF